MSSSSTRKSSPRISRRGLLGRGGALLAGMPLLRFGSGSLEGERLFVLVELVGGNDGLNMIVPFEDPAYHAARPRLRVRGGGLALGEGFCLHPRMEALLPLWKEGEMAVLHGVGYPRPDRSHFRSRDVWHSGRPDLETPSQGWLGRAAAAMPKDGSMVRAMGLGEVDLSLVLRSPRLAVPALPDLESYMLHTDGRARRRRDARLRELAALQETARDDAIGRLLARCAREALEGSERLREAAASWRPKAGFPTHAFGRRCALASRALTSSLVTRIVHLRHHGFDTHASQNRTHGTLLGDLATGLSALAADLRARGLWKRCLVLCFSEFGRRLAENRSGGTDHGKAGPVLALGGSLKGGFHGRATSLTALDDGDPSFTTDFRRVFAEVCERWLSVPSRPVFRGSFPPLNFLPRS